METLIGVYPIIDGGETVGELRVAQRGLMLSFEGSCPDAGEIMRLSVYGEREGYLGVMLPGPDSGHLTISKRLSRAALRDFPSKIEYAGAAGAGAAGPALEAEAVAEEPQAAVDAEDILWIPEPNPWSLFSDREQKEAWRSVSGILRSEHENTILLAMPSGEAGKMKGVYMTADGVRELDGEKYIIFKIDDGKIN